MLNVVSFYRFVDIDDPPAIRLGLQTLCEKHRLLGTVLLAREGVNGTLAGEGDDIRRVFDWMMMELSLHEGQPIDGRWTEAGRAPFRRMRVRVKNEIVTLGRPDILPQRMTDETCSF